MRSYQPTCRSEGMVSDLRKMMKSWRESWSRDSKVASQAVILMFIPIILGLGFNKRAAWKKIGRRLKSEETPP